MQSTQAELQRIATCLLVACGSFAGLREFEHSAGLELVDCIAGLAWPAAQLPSTSTELREQSNAFSRLRDQGSKNPAKC